MAFSGLNTAHYINSCNSETLSRGTIITIIQFYNEEFKEIQKVK